MQRALIDTSVLFAAAYRRDEAHEDALQILQGIDDGSLPNVVVLDFVLAETLNGLTVRADAGAATDFLDRVEENACFHIRSLTTDGFATAKVLFRQHGGFSFVDACLVAFMQAEGLDYLYAYDEDFDAAEDIYRLDTPSNPYDPE